MLIQCGFSTITESELYERLKYRDSKKTKKIISVPISNSFRIEYYAFLSEDKKQIYCDMMGVTKEFADSQL